MIDMVVPRHDLGTLGRIIDLMRCKERGADGVSLDQDDTASGGNNTARRASTDAVLERLSAFIADRSRSRTYGTPACRSREPGAIPTACHPRCRHQWEGFHHRLHAGDNKTAGLRVHVYTSPHLVRFNERIVLDGAPVGRALLAILEECEVANDGAPITFFEITTAAAFVAFSRTPADLVLLETGLGGRFDSTNVLPSPGDRDYTGIDGPHVFPRRHH